MFNRQNLQIQTVKTEDQIIVILIKHETISTFHFLSNTIYLSLTTHVFHLLMAVIC